MIESFDEPRRNEPAVSELEQRREHLRQAGQVAAEWAIAFSGAAQEGLLADFMLDKDSSLSMLAEKILALSNDFPAVKEWPNDVMGITVGNLDLSVRTHNVLLRHGINTIGGMSKLSRKTILSYRNAGPSVANEVKTKLGEFGIELPDK